MTDKLLGFASLIAAVITLVTAYSSDNIAATMGLSFCAGINYMLFIGTLKCHKSTRKE